MPADEYHYDVASSAETVIAAHVYRAGAITCTVLIRSQPDGQWRIHRIGKEPINDAIVPTLELATDLADMYLAGFLEGYDEGVERGWKEHPGHQRSNVEVRPSRWRQRRDRRESPAPSQYRDRADDEGAGESVGSD